MEKDNINDKKMDGQAFKRKSIYSKDNLMPDEILSLISYKQTYQALENDDQEAL